MIHAMDTEKAGQGGLEVLGDVADLKNWSL